MSDSWLFWINMLTASFLEGHSYAQEIKHPDVCSMVIDYNGTINFKTREWS